MSLLKALLCQLMAALLIHIPALDGLDQNRLLLHGSLAATLSMLMHQPRWWIPIQFGFWPGIGWFQNLALPPNTYLWALLLMVFVFWGTIKGDVPLFLSSHAVAGALSDFIERERSTSLIELGAGIGSVVVPLAIRHPHLKITALERAPLPWLILRWRCRTLKNVEIVRQNFWQHDLAPYSIAFAFLSPLVMERLAVKASAEMRPGCLLISSSFSIPHWPSETTWTLDDRRQTALYGYRMVQGLIDAGAP